MREFEHAPPSESGDLSSSFRSHPPLLAGGGARRAEGGEVRRGLNCVRH